MGWKIRKSFSDLSLKYPQKTHLLINNCEKIASARRLCVLAKGAEAGIEKDDHNNTKDCPSAASAATIPLFECEVISLFEGYRRILPVSRLYLYDVHPVEIEASSNLISNTSQISINVLFQIYR
ncbi:hypothetical protein J6590_085595 [Homalodisca vitripennis]|nr:hypothetical protein J6590_085595 [Homalodisca vitripennis]